MKICVAGLGYVGLSNGVLLAQNHDVVGLDINAARVAMVNARKSPIADPEIEHFLAHERISFRATTDADDAIDGAEVVIVATPTDYDPATNSFNTRSLETVVTQVLDSNDKALIVIKSTVPVGYTERLRKAFETDRIIFSPEFLREGKALHDNLYPSRIIVGDQGENGQRIAGLLKQGARKADISVLLTGSTEAEAIKLFANTYLAMRVSFFNELDSFALTHGLEARQIVEGVSLDPRVGNYYNNPSFGYGGYCLPKDTKQLLSNYRDVPQNLIRAIVESNETRMDFIAEDIMRRKPKVVGIYRLVMKEGSDNFKESSVLGVINRIQKKGAQVIVFEPAISENHYLGIEVTRDIAEFKRRSEIVISNRQAPDLQDGSVEIYTRDIFREN
ncbi:MAG: nucleotide sugar dehydrogenase [Proteobacteria bacterium]|nr:nucleotide sugar dehydrogenase [Pseudomonadota bacterium]